MLAVFTFLVILVLSMTLLEKLVAVLPGAAAPEKPTETGAAEQVGDATSGTRADEQALVAAAIAAIHRHRHGN